MSGAVAAIPIQVDMHTAETSRLLWSLKVDLAALSSGIELTGLRKSDPAIYTYHWLFLPLIAKMPKFDETGIIHW